MENDRLNSDVLITSESLEDTEEKRIHFYNRITNDLKSKEKHYECVKRIQSFSGRLLAVVLKDVASPNETLVMAGLNVLVYILFVPQLLKCISQAEAGGIVTALWNLLEVQKNDKNITTRVLWCLSTQQIPLDYLKDDLPKLISKVGEVLISRESISVAVDQEGLNVLKRFHDSSPEVFSHAIQVVCLKGIIRILTTKSAKNYHAAREMAKQLTMANPELSRKIMYKELSRGRIGDMKNIFVETGHHYHTTLLQTWSLFVTLMEKALHSSSHKLLNEMLKIVEMGFTHGKEAVQVASYQAWQSLIVNFSSASDFVSGKKKLKLLMTPLRSEYLKLKSKRLSLARVKCWWCLISNVFKTIPMSEVYMEENVVPFLFACIGVNHHASKDLMGKMTTEGMLEVYQDVHQFGSDKDQDEMLKTSTVDLSAGPLSPEIPLTPISPSNKKSLSQFVPIRPPVDSRADSTSHLTPAPPPLLSFDSSSSLQMQDADLDSSTRSTSSVLYDSPLVLQCLLVGVQVWLGIMEQYEEVVEGSEVKVVPGMHVWEYSDWLLDKYPGLLFVSVEVCAKALRSSGDELLTKALVQFWTAICKKMTQTWARVADSEGLPKGEDSPADKYQVVCLYELISLLSTTASIRFLSAEQFGEMLKSFHDCVMSVAQEKCCQEFLYSGKWKHQSTLDQRVKVLPVHRLLEVLLTSKFEELSVSQECSFAFIWEIISGTLGGDICMANKKEVFTGIYSLTKGLPSSVTRLVQRFVDKQTSFSDSKGSPQTPTDTSVSEDKVMESDVTEVDTVSSTAADQQDVSKVEEAILPESDLSPATPLHQMRKRNGEDLSRPPAKQLRLSPTMEVPNGEDGTAGKNHIKENVSMEHVEKSQSALMLESPLPTGERDPSSEPSSTTINSHTGDNGQGSTPVSNLEERKKRNTSPSSQRKKRVKHSEQTDHVDVDVVVESEDEEHPSTRNGDKELLPQLLEATEVSTRDESLVGNKDRCADGIPVDSSQDLFSTPLSVVVEKTDLNANVSVSTPSRDPSSTSTPYNLSSRDHSASASRREKAKSKFSSMQKTDKRRRNEVSVTPREPPTTTQPQGSSTPSYLTSLDAVHSRGARALMQVLTPSRSSFLRKLPPAQLANWTFPYRSSPRKRSILKRPRQIVTPSRCQDRRVSFADPIEEHRSPEKRKKFTRKSSKLQPRRLEKDSSGDAGVGHEGKEDVTVEVSTPLYLPLLDCNVSAEVLIPQLDLISQGRGSQFLSSFEVKTIGELAMMKITDIAKDPLVSSPKVENIQGIMREFHSSLVGGTEVASGTTSEGTSSVNRGESDGKVTQDKTEYLPESVEVDHAGMSFYTPTSENDTELSEGNVPKGPSGAVPTENIPLKSADNGNTATESANEKDLNAVNHTQPSVDSEDPEEMKTEDKDECEEVRIYENEVSPDKGEEVIGRPTTDKNEESYRGTEEKGSDEQVKLGTDVDFESDMDLETVQEEEMRVEAKSDNMELDSECQELHLEVEPLSLNSDIRRQEEAHMETASEETQTDMDSVKHFIYYGMNLTREQVEDLDITDRFDLFRSSLRVLKLLEEIGTTF